MKLKLHFLLFFLLASSCTLIIKSIEKPLIPKSKIKKAPSSPLHCSLENKYDFQLVGSKDNSQEVYLELMKKLTPRLDFLDHFVLWGLMQLSIRPDQTSLSSRFQVILHHEGKSHYFDFFSESSEAQYPFLYGLEWILKKFGKKTTLEYYASLLGHPVLKKLKVGKDFENFLVKNLDAIKNDEFLTPYYFRGAEVLKENETSPNLNYRHIIQLYRKEKSQQKIIVNTMLNEFFTESGFSGKCNYDFNLYDNSIFLIDKIIPVANIYGLSNSASAFLASTSQKLDRIQSLKGLSLFQGESKVRSSAVCMIENSKRKIWVFANQSRDPGQHLFHLVRYGLPSAQSIDDVTKLIKHSRHLFLSDPVRLVIESQRSSSKQIENLLKLNVPIYNADSLANIWAYTQFNQTDRFIIDDRNPGEFTCK